MIIRNGKYRIIRNGKYRIIRNFLTRFIKSLHLDGRKECKCDLKMDRRTLQFLSTPHTAVCVRIL
jgi:hypothetical protein